MTPRTGESAKIFAVDALRKAMLDGNLVAGQRLVEPDLAEKLGASQSSVRAALIDLTVEGLVERIPNKGARVRVIPVQEAIEINECRMVLDGLCAAKAAEIATDAQIEELREFGRQMTRAVDDGEPLKYSELNLQLHRRIRVISGQTVATRLVERLHEQVTRHQFRLALAPGRAQAWLPEHLAVIEAIARRDASSAEAAAREHLANVIAILRTTSD
ncbi:MAG TPA: GntR family transcriptional regulator [Pseudonocardiaceae bacterium]|jgi:DNA-binding GntR family transcriptional regulator|nr:GntR family transcriptional regulator [Pseudonocardiaceae bacterium]